MKLKYVVRPMEERDLPGVISLLNEYPQCAMQHWETPEFLASRLPTHGKCCFVAVEFVNDVEVDLIGAVIACAGMTRGTIEHIAVREGFRGIGISMKLGEEAERGIRILGIRRIQAIVVPGNIVAEQYWRKRGYICPEGERLMQTVRLTAQDVGQAHPEMLRGFLEADFPNPLSDAEIKAHGEPKLVEVVTQE